MSAQATRSARGRGRSSQTSAWGFSGTFRLSVHSCAPPLHDKTTLFFGQNQVNTRPRPSANASFSIDPFGQSGLFPGQPEQGEWSGAGGWKGRLGSW